LEDGGLSVRAPARAGHKPPHPPVRRICVFERICMFECLASLALVLPPLVLPDAPPCRNQGKLRIRVVG